VTRHLLGVLGLLRPRWRRLVLGALAATAASACSVALLGAGAWLIARASQQPELAALSVAIVAVRAFAVGRGVARYLERLVTHDATLRTLTDVRVRVYRRLEPLAPTGLSAFRDGDLLSRFVADVDGVQDVVLRALLPLASGLVVGVGSAAVVAALLPEAAAVVLAVVLVVAVVLPWLTGRLARGAGRAAVEARAELATAVVDTLGRVPELVAYDAAGQRLGRLQDIDRRLQRQLDRTARAEGAGAGALALLVGLAVWGVLVVSVAAVRSGTLGDVALVVVVLLPLALVEVLGALPAAGRQLARGTASTARVLDVLDRPDPVHEPLRPRPLPDPPYRLRVEDLAVRWTPTGPDVVTGLDLDLLPGARVALVGPSGSGKTTVAMALLRLLDPSSGRITLGGVATADLAGDDVRRVVGLLAQDAHIFDSTVLENVRLARPDATTEEIRAALAGARLLGWADALPDGLDTWVGQHGARISGGERQRLALARTLLADPAVLVLDEPTEHLDARTADDLTRDLLDATHGRSVLLVTHRLAGLEAMDEVVVLDRGRVAARGTHAELVAAGGRYADAVAQERAASALLPWTAQPPPR
jgi:thiol reductant ABC exporter CydC subunit